MDRQNYLILKRIIDPQKEAVHIYRQDGSIKIKKGKTIELSGEDVLPGLVMEVNF